MLEKEKFHINAVHKSIMWRKRQLYIQDLDETEECSVLPASIQDIKIKEEELGWMKGMWEILKTRKDCELHCRALTAEIMRARI